MADLFILMPSRAGEVPLYAWRSAGEWLADTSLPADRSFGRGENVVAFVPATAVTVHGAEVAARKPAEARRIALFALEDELAEPVDQVHVALGAASADSVRRDVLVASRADMDAWMAWLQEVKLPDAALYAPQLCLPGGRIAVAAPDEILFRTPETAFALDTDAPGELIKTLAPEGLETVYGEGLAHALDLEAAAPAYTRRENWLAQLAEWHRTADPAHFISLRQGDYSVTRPLNLDGISRWRSAGALAAGCAMLWLGTVWLETQALENEAQDLRLQTSELMTAVAPEANGRLSVALEELRRDTRAASAALRPTEASAALYEALAPVGNAEIRSLRYDAGNGQLRATVVFDNYSQADAIGARLEDSGLAVTLGEARQSGSRVMGELVIEGGTS